MTDTPTFNETPGLVAASDPTPNERWRDRIQRNTAEILAALGESAVQTCAGCGDPIPAGTPPYPADFYGLGRLCAPCLALVPRQAGDELVASPTCTSGALFFASEMDEHRNVAHEAAGVVSGNGETP